MRSMLQNDLGSYVQDAIRAGAASSAAGLQKVLEIQRDWILNKAAGISENFDYSYGASPFYTPPLPLPISPTFFLSHSTILHYHTSLPHFIIILHYSIFHRLLLRSRTGLTSRLHHRL
jgi:hypothetical protein